MKERPTETYSPNPSNNTTVQKGLNFDSRSKPDTFDPSKTVKTPRISMNETIGHQNSPDQFVLRGVLPQASFHHPETLQPPLHSPNNKQLPTQYSSNNPTLSKTTTTGYQSLSSRLHAAPRLSYTPLTGNTASRSTQNLTGITAGRSLTPTLGQATASRLKPPVASSHTNIAQCIPNPARNAPTRPHLAQVHPEQPENPSGSASSSQPLRKPAPTQRRPAQPEDCAICWESLDKQAPNSQFLECFHCFHKQCLRGWIGTHKNCPTCKHPTKVSA